MEYTYAVCGIAGVLFMLCASPGPSFVVISTTAIASNRWNAILVGLGVAAATFTWASAAALGLGLLLSKIAWLYRAIRLIGALYLIFLGLRLIVNCFLKNKPADQQEFAHGTQKGNFKKGYLVAVSNPTAVIFFGSMFSTMLPMETPYWIYLTAATVVTLISATWHCGIAVVFSMKWIQSAYRKLKFVFDAAAGATLVMLGFRMANSE